MLTFQKLCNNLKHNPASWVKRPSIWAPPQVLNRVIDVLANIAPVTACHQFCLCVTQKNCQCQWNQYALDCHGRGMCESNRLGSQIFMQRNSSLTSMILLDKEELWYSLQSRSTRIRMHCIAWLGACWYTLIVWASTYLLDHEYVDN